MTAISLRVPLVPPSVNHYKLPIERRSRLGRTCLGFRVTPEGKAFKAAIAIAAKGQSIAPATQRERDKIRYYLAVTIVLGPGQRGDGDNFWKCIADGLVEAGVIHSDARVKVWHLELDDEDRTNPRTEIFASVMNGEK
ncbi:RusA family crossover junction endodeoxyribonuclease [Terriglobus saanensis]|uniref:Endodeoxyribonuclease RusA n=1 Tax=Terriglobus saanensis (strain ATCC BAA-1853 / DSM 23119 / SP1PR4) TaxID=401053 RepID=E8V6P7_TERSS|nr:RusA family crossover junction endodeoxyribonuclease [Terriglobus saanensis]ADV83849.1 endodeoxyribonuclease RusA [Terriglobus saanensis SP1PR4]